MNKSKKISILENPENRKKTNIVSIDIYSAGKSYDTMFFNLNTRIHSRLPNFYEAKNTYDEDFLFL